MTQIPKNKLLRILLVCLAVCLFMTLIGCDQSNSDSYGWGNDTTTPESGDAMQSGDAPYKPTPERKTPAPAVTVSATPTKSQTPASSSKPTPTPLPTPTPTPTRRPHVHNWENEVSEYPVSGLREIVVTEYVCSLCGYTTESAHEAASHAGTPHEEYLHTIQVHSQSLPYVCDCGQGFASEAECQAHIDYKMDHPDHAPDLSQMTLTLIAYWCAGGDCTAADDCAPGETPVMEHIEGCGPEFEQSEPITYDRYVCLCGLTFTTDDELGAHTDNDYVPHDVITFNENNVLISYSCNKCEFVSTSQEEANAHAASVALPIPYSAKTSNRIEEYVEWQTGTTGRYICSSCGAIRSE